MINAGPVRAIVVMAAVGVLAVPTLAVVRRHRTGSETGAQRAAESRVEQAPAAGGQDLLAGGYTVAAGDTLGQIAARFGTSVSALMQANGITDPDAIFVGQELRLQIVTSGDGPDTRLVPDGELVNGPAYLGFDAAALATGLGGPLAAHQELVNGTMMTGPEILQRVATDFSVGPRVLLAFLEARSGWVTGRPPEGAAGHDYPAGLEDPARTGLWLQLNWLADRLNGGYYDWKTRGSRVLTLRDGTYLAGHESLEAGSFAVQRAMAYQSTASELPKRLAAFDAAYRRLFGDPWQSAVPTPAGSAPRFPELALPWARGETWWMTGGPHGGWAEGSARAAFDFVPAGDPLGCAVAEAWATAVADGWLLEAGDGALYLDLDDDRDRRTGEGVFYLHLAAFGRASAGTQVRAGDRLGHPSCEGGASSATHLHIARLRDGEWLAADGADPFVMGGWAAVGAPEAYDGGLLHPDHGERTACECRLEGHNDVGW